MRRPLVTSVGLILTVCWLSHAVLRESMAADEKDQVLFSFADEATIKDWMPIKLPDVEKDQPARKVEIVPAPKTEDDLGPAGKCLKITFEGGDWPTVGTMKIPVQGNWKQSQTLKADLTVDRPSVAYFRIYQGKPDEKPQQPRWERITAQPTRPRKPANLVKRRQSAPWWTAIARQA